MTTSSAHTSAVSSDIDSSQHSTSNEAQDFANSANSSSPAPQFSDFPRASSHRSDGSRAVAGSHRHQTSTHSAKTPHVLNPAEEGSSELGFDSFGLHPQILHAVEALGYKTPTPIQVQAIPTVLAGRDVMGLAQTGTGKTAAFVLPILQQLINSDAKGVRALVVVPTRELAEQIATAVKQYSSRLKIRCMTIYGGVAMGPQVARLRAGTDIVIACPGRLLDHVNQGTVDLSKVAHLVLDEADQMFDMGFLPDIRKILKRIPDKRQTLLFSATMPSDVQRLAEEIMDSPAIVRVGRSSPAETITHALYPIDVDSKTQLLLGLLKGGNVTSTLIFTRTKHRAKRLADQLYDSGYKTTSLQGNLSQAKRQQALDGFRSGRFQILVATDIAARGIDISRVSHVINYDIPGTPEAYTHRIGRTGRAERTGDAYTLVTREDVSMVREIERFLGKKIEVRKLEGFNYKDSFNLEASLEKSGRSQGRSGRPANRSFHDRGRRPRTGGSGDRSEHRSSGPRSSQRSGPRSGQGSAQGVEQRVERGAGQSTEHRSTERSDSRLAPRSEHRSGQRSDRRSDGRSDHRSDNRSGQRPQRNSGPRRGR